MMQKTYELVGEALCLDFTNTVGGWRGGELTENLHGYGDLLSWGVQAGSITTEQEAQLLREAEKRPDEAAAVLAGALELRETLFRIFDAVAHEQTPDAEDMAVFNADLAQAMAHVQVTQHGDHFHWSWLEDNRDFSSVLWAVLRSAGDLLTTTPQLQYVRECGNDECDWLFVDTTKNHSRRWCDMKGCGNRMKVRKHRKKQQS